MGVDKNIEEIAIRQFRDLFIATYRNSEKLQNTTLEEHGIIGDAYEWPIIGKVEHKKRTSAISKPAPSEVKFDKIITTFEEYILNIPLDKSQERLLRANVQSQYVKAHRDSLGRRIDQFKLDALANATEEVQDAKTNMTVAKLLEAKTILDGQNCPTENRILFMGHEQINSLFNDAKATNSDYVGMIDSIYNGKMDTLLGFRFIWTGRGEVGILPEETPGIRTCYAWHKDAIGIAYNMDPTFWITEDETKTSYLTLSRTKLGANLLQKSTAGSFEGAVRIFCDENA